MNEEVKTYIIGWDISKGKDESAVVLYENKGDNNEVKNVIIGEEAYRIVKRLLTVE